jgi:hypothetical protein
MSHDIATADQIADRHSGQAEVHGANLRVSLLLAVHLAGRLYPLRTFEEGEITGD